MKTRIFSILILSILVVLGTSACASKKYVRNRINERVAPLEQRTGELEETSRRNAQDIAALNEDVKDIRGRTTAIEQSVGDLRENLDKYTLQNTAVVNFKVNSWQLTPESMAALDQLASQIKDRNNYILEIQGFADSTGSEGYNNQLTEKRAAAVCRYLADRQNISLYRMHVLGFGKIRPVADNSTREGRAQNRRVEVHLLVRNINGTTGGPATTTSTTSENIRQ